MMGESSCRGHFSTPSGAIHATTTARNTCKTMIKTGKSNTGTRVCPNIRLTPYDASIQDFLQLRNIRPLLQLNLKDLTLSNSVAHLIRCVAKKWKLPPNSLTLITPLSTSAGDRFTLQNRDINAEKLWNLLNQPNPFILFYHIDFSKVDSSPNHPTPLTTSTKKSRAKAQIPPVDSIPKSKSSLHNISSSQNTLPHIQSNSTKKLSQPSPNNLPSLISTPFASLTSGSSSFATTASVNASIPKNSNNLGVYVSQLMNASLDDSQVPSSAYSLSAFPQILSHQISYANEKQVYNTQASSSSVGAVPSSLQHIPEQLSKPLSDLHTDNNGNTTYSLSSLTAPIRSSSFSNSLLGFPSLTALKSPKAAANAATTSSPSLTSALNTDLPITLNGFPTELSLSAFGYPASSSQFWTSENSAGFLNSSRLSSAWNEQTSGNSLHAFPRVEMAEWQNESALPSFPVDFQ